MNLNEIYSKQGEKLATLLDSEQKAEHQKYYQVIFLNFFKSKILFLFLFIYLLFHLLLHYYSNDLLLLFKKKCMHCKIN
jgi:hypothetical protein